METGDIDILMLLFSINVTPTQICQIMEKLKGPDAGTFMPKRAYDMNKKNGELHDFAYGLLPDSNYAEKNLSKLERSNINHFYILHNDTGVYACSKGRPSNEEVRVRLDCSAKIQADLESLRDDYHLVWATELLLAAIGLVFPALVLGYNFFIVKSMTYQFLYRLKNLYDYHWQQ